MSNKSILTIVGLAVAGLVTGIAVNQYIAANKPPPQETASSAPISTNMAQAFTLTDLQDKTRNSSEWNGKVRLVNFWASWCPPCVREIPAFIKLHNQYKDKNFTVLGIALDEKQAVIDFIDPIGESYPMLIAEQEGISLTKAYGNRLGVLPYTALLDTNGVIVKTYMRELSFEEAEQIIKPYLETGAVAAKP